MDILAVIEDYLQRITCYRDGLTDLLEKYILLDKPDDHYQIRVKFIQEIKLSNFYLTKLHQGRQDLLQAKLNMAYEQDWPTLKNLEDFLQLTNNINEEIKK